MFLCVRLGYEKQLRLWDYTSLRISGSRALGASAKTPTSDPAWRKPNDESQYDEHQMTKAHMTTTHMTKTHMTNTHWTKTHTYIPLWRYHVRDIFHYGCIMIIFCHGCIPYGYTAWWLYSIMDVFHYGYIPLWLYPIVVIFHKAIPHYC